MAQETRSDGRLVSLLVTPKGCIEPASGGGQRTQLFLEALKRLGPVVVAVNGRAKEEDLRALVPDALKVVALGGTPPKPFPGTGRLAVWRRHNRRYRYLQEYALNPAARRALRQVVEEQGVGAIVFRYFISYYNSVGPDDLDLQRMSFVDLDDRDDELAQRAWTSALGPVGAMVYGSVVHRLIRGKMQALRRANAHFVLSEGDDLGVGRPAVYAPNTVLSEPDPAGNGRPSARRDILFVGGYGHFPNRPGVTWFLRKCWPEIHRQHPDCRFRIVGAGGWEEMAPEFAEVEGVDFVGFVEDLAPEYRASRLVVAPLLEGGGTTIKVVEAAAFGRPVVATPVAARGLAADFFAALSAAAEPEEFTAACLELLADDGLADRRGAALLDMQKAYYSRAPIVASIAAAIEDLRPREALPRLRERESRPARAGRR